MHKIRIQNKPGTEDQIGHAGNTTLLLDGTPIKSAQSVKFEVIALGLSKVTIVMYADIAIEANVEVLAYEQTGKNNQYEIGGLEPREGTDVGDSE